jgi:hypothetical protein
MTQITVDIQNIEQKEILQLIPEPEDGYLELFHNNIKLVKVPGKIEILTQLQYVIHASYSLGREDAIECLHDEWDQFRKALELL